MQPNVSVSLDIERKSDQYVAYNGCDNANEGRPFLYLIAGFSGIAMMGGVAGVTLHRGIDHHRRPWRFDVSLPHRQARELQ
jgi:hypothetical protein